MPRKLYKDYSDYVSHRLAEIGKEVNSLTLQETQQIDQDYAKVFADYQNQVRQLAASLNVQLLDLIKFLNDIDPDISINDFQELAKTKTTKSKSAKKQPQEISTQQSKKTTEDLTFEGSI